MERQLRTRVIVLFALWVLWVGINPPCGLTQDERPKLVMDEREFDFGEVKENDTIEHAFKVLNQGNATLEIKMSSSDLVEDCAVTYFDKAIPPGGEGKIILKVDTTGYQGAVIRRCPGRYQRSGSQDRFSAGKGICKDRSVCESILCLPDRARRSGLNQDREHKGWTGQAADSHSP